MKSDHSFDIRQEYYGKTKTEYQREAFREYHYYLSGLIEALAEMKDGKGQSIRVIRKND